MAERRRRQREEGGPGWLSTLGGAALLVVLGFGVGLVAGAAWEEPDLVMAHLAGRTTELPLVAENPADPPSVSTAPPTRGPAPPEKGGFAIQVGAFGDENAAARLAGELRAAGFTVYVHSDDGRSGVRFQVRVGPVPSREEATRLASQLKSDHQLPTWILSHDSR
jgi:cell division septation protein DedD